MPSFLLDILFSAKHHHEVCFWRRCTIAGPVEFSVVPTSRLRLTRFPLGLNISSSRLILIPGNAGARAAGLAIEASGDFGGGLQFAQMPADRGGLGLSKSIESGSGSPAAQSQ